MLNVLKTLAAAGVVTMAAGAASAATVYATSVSGTLIGDQQITTCTVAVRDTNRANMCNALGEEDVDGAFQDGGFASLAKFDALTFSYVPVQIVVSDSALADDHFGDRVAIGQSKEKTPRRGNSCPSFGKAHDIGGAYQV